MEPAATDDVAGRHARFARNEAHAHSEVYERWALALSQDADTCALVATLPPGKRQPNIVFACARLHGAEPGDYDNLRRVLHERWDAVRCDILARSTQTNEVARCGVLLPLLAELAAREGRPLALIEAGASAGLCLLPDAWSYRWRDRSGDVLAAIDTPDAAGTIEVTVKDAGIDLPGRMPPIGWREGIDLNPLDATDPTARDWLRTLVWPGQDTRLARLDAALEVASRSGVRVRPGDLCDPGVVDAALDRVPDGCVPVVFHTAVLAYLDTDQRVAFTHRMMQRVDARRCHWISNEGAGVVEPFSDTLGAWPHRLRPGAFVVALDGAPRFQADGHAGWIAA